MITMNTNVLHIATQPVICPVPSAATITIMTKLSKLPSNLFVFWRKYEQRLSGGKEEKDYTAVEQGHNKHTHSHKKVFWVAFVKWM